MSSAPDPERAAGGAPWASRASVLLALVTLLLAAAFVVDASRQIWVYGLGELYADQFRQYRRIIEQGLAESLILPDNGHRQLFSNAVRWADIALGQGDQRWGIAAGLLAMLGAWGAMLAVLWRGRRDPLPVTAACSLLAALALFWFGAGRMQFHGNETLQVYLVVACAVLANACLVQPGRDPWRRWAVISLLGVVAMLSFATGVAVLAGALALAVVLRRPWRELLGGGLLALACVVTYTFLLPGGEGVRNTVRLEPLSVAATAATWLGSAPVVAWLGLGNEGLLGASPQRIAEAGALASTMVESAAAVRAGLGLDSQLSAAFPAGVLGLVLLGLACLQAWLRPAQVSRGAALGLGLSLFAAALGFLVAIGRLEYFRDHPQQVLADRYVLWGALFWFGLACYGMARLGAGQRAGLAAPLLAWLALGVLWTSHQVGAGWSRASARAIEARAAQAQTGLLQPGWAPFSDLPDLDAVRDHLDFYRARHLAQFRTARSRSLGSDVRERLSAAADAPAARWWQHFCNPLDPKVDGRPGGWHVAGVVERRAAADEGLIAVDGAGRVVGLGEFGFQHDGPWLARIDAAARGFDLFIVDDGSLSGPPALWVVDGPMQRLRRLEPAPCLAP